MKLRTFIPLICCLAAIHFTSPARAETLGEVGLKVGTLYSTGKAFLIKSGWKVSEDKDPSISARYPQFPEVSCGTGRDAVCSVGFEKQHGYLALIVEKRGTELIIAGEY